MVRIVGYKTIEKEDGDEFLALTVQGGIEIVKSKTTGKSYFTARIVNLPATFDEETCKSLIGSDFEGNIIKVPCEPYEYTIRETGEVVMINYRYEYVDEEQQLMEEQVVEKELVS